MRQIRFLQRGGGTGGISCPACIVAVALLLVNAVPVLAQGATTVSDGLTLRQTLSRLTAVTGSPAAAEAMALTTSLEVTTGPYGTSSGGFVFKLDPATGLQARTATTFGPSFAERALTLGEGKVSVAANLVANSYSRLGDLSTDRMKLSSSTATTPELTRTGTTSLAMSSTTLVVSGMVGVTDKLDMGVAVPMVKVKIDGLSWVQTANVGVTGQPEVILLANGSGIASGLGDVAASAKYRFYSFGEGTPDPGGLAVMATVRLPTGDVENFRGLGITRTLVSFIASSGTGRLRPHVNAGYEWWSDGIKVQTDFAANPTFVVARDQLQWAAGAEFEAVPKLTLLVDLLGRRVRGAGQVGYRTDAQPPNRFGVTSIESMVALPDGVQKILLVPGMKVNVKGSMLFSLNVLTALKDNGLHARVTPVASVDLTF